MPLRTKSGISWKWTARRFSSFFSRDAVRFPVPPTLLYIAMKTLKSSWNSDRVAAATIAKRTRRVRSVHTPFAQYRLGSDEVQVLTRRGRVIFARRFDGTIASACVRGDMLEVETTAGSRYVCDAQTGEILEEWPSLEAAATTVESNASALVPAMEGITSAA